MLAPMGTGLPDGTSRRANGAPGRVLLACLEAACAAPSVHNTQPWRFLLHPGAIDVYADPGRRPQPSTMDGGARAPYRWAVSR